MPTKKSSGASRSTPKATPKAAEKSQTSPSAHTHAALEASIAALKEEVAALKGQCHSCCTDIAELKSAPQERSGFQDPRLDEIIKYIESSLRFGDLKSRVHHYQKKLKKLNK